MKMKSLLYKTLIALFLGGVIMSCEDTLVVESQSSLDESVIFSNPSLAEGAVAVLFTPLERPIHTGGGSFFTME
ncbi:hypothetical protein [Geofilum rubicundum]|uniref:hypothetical protein n=1 Tax=Geofilum rubicundum TaxID=472113 RepID=UPI001D0ECBC9|nr:hypothetical protein [Geofilum rubicundum]